MKAKEYLQRISKIDRIIINKVVELNQWKSIAMGTTIQLTEKVQTSSNGQMMANAVCTYIDIEKDIARCVNELAAEKKEIIKTIEQIDDELYYDILHKIYVQYLTFQDVADDYDKSKSWVTSKNGTALKKLQDILDERKDKNE